MALSNDDKMDLLTELASNGNRPGRAASTLNLNFDDVMQFVSERDRVQASQSYLAADFPIGKNCIIASKKVGCGWDKSEALDQAKRDYDRGDVDMCQSREGDIIHQNVQRRRLRDVKRVPYFSRHLVA